MVNKDVKAVPTGYKRSIAKDLQGTVQEVDYLVRNYINEKRKFVTSLNITTDEVGRETVNGEPISKKCSVYLPAGYNQEDINKKYNVLYLLHGVGGNHLEWLTGSGEADGQYVICNILDNLIANGEMDPTIVVFPNGRSSHDYPDRSFNPEGTNMLGFYYFDYELRYDLIPFIESTYHTYANIEETTAEAIAFSRKHRAIAGLSMGGMQALNLGLGGYRCDSAVYTGAESSWDNGLVTTVQAPGMKDLFTYVGAFSNAPTSSDGNTLGTSVSASDYKLDLLYITCGDADEVAIESGFNIATKGLSEAADDKLADYYEVIISNGLHDFDVWNNGAYNFARLAFEKKHVTKMTIDLA